MNSQVRMVVFDMAGTTVDEDNVVYKTIQKALAHYDHIFTLDQVLTYCAGKEKRTAIIDILTNLEGKDINPIHVDTIFDYFKSELKTAYREMEVKTFDRTLEVFQKLRSASIQIVLNTGYDRVTATGLLSKLNWTEGVDYDFLVTADDVVLGRPNPDMIQLAMHKGKITDPKQVVKVGDSCIDIEEGKAAGCIYSIGITSGAQPKEELALANPDYIIDSLVELESILGLPVEAA
ncbi:Phosphoglycolate phosphatase [compost metagenome]